MKKSHQGITALLSLAIFGLLQGSYANACSVSVNSLYQQNLLVGLAAAEMSVNLATATSIAVADYGHSFSGSTGPSSCPTHLNTHARVSINYKKNIFTRCSLSVTINRSVQMGDVLVPGPFESVSTALPTSSCTLIPVGRHP